MLEVILVMLCYPAYPASGSLILYNLVPHTCTPSKVVGVRSVLKSLTGTLVLENVCELYFFSLVLAAFHRECGALIVIPRYTYDFTYSTGSPSNVNDCSSNHVCIVLNTCTLHFPLFTLRSVNTKVFSAST